MRLRLFWLSLYLPLAALAACEPGSGIVGTAIGGPGGGTTTSATTASVQITDTEFSPASVTVSRGASGARVTWTWVGDSLHDVAFDLGGPNAAAQRAGTFTRVFAETGTFTYTCTIHGRVTKVGQVIVAR